LNKNVLIPKNLDNAAGLKVQTINKTCSTQISAFNAIFAFSKHEKDKKILRNIPTKVNLNPKPSTDG